MREHQELFQLDVFVRGRVKKTPEGAEFLDSDDRIVVSDGTVHMTVGNGVGVWVRRGDGRSGWLKPLTDNEHKTFQAPVQTGDVYFVGDGEFWKFPPEELLSHVEEIGGNGSIVSCVVRPVLQDDRVIPVVAPVPFAKRFGDAASKMRSRLPYRKDTPVFVVHGGDMEMDPQKQKRLLVSGLVTIIFLGIVVGGGHIRRSGIAAVTTAQNQTIETIVAKFREAKGVAGMDPQRSKQLLAEVDVGLQGLAKDFSSDPRLDEVRAGMGDVLGAVSGTQALSPTLLVDLGLLREGIQAKGIVQQDKFLWVMDASGERVIQVNPGTGAPKIVFGQSQLGSSQSISAYPGKLFLLTEKGVASCALEGSSCQIVVEKDSEWGTISSMGVWAGNIYLVDTGKQKIWKYPVIESGFGARQTWFEIDDETPPGILLEGGQGLAIDGSLWVSDSATSLLKFTRGVAEKITLSGIGRDLGGYRRVYTQEDIESIYLLDRDNGRILKVNKSGVFDSQWTDPSLKQAEAFVVSESEGVVWWVSGSKVWQGRL